MPSRSPHSRRQDGFTIIETLVASVLLLIGMAATLTLVDTASSTTATTRAREQGTNLQRELIEAARSVPYDQLTPNGVGATVRTRPALGDASGATPGWTIRRRDTTYTVSMGVCTVDDPRDGNGSHDQPGVFCPPTPSPPPDCPALIKASALGTLPGAGAAVDASAGLCGIDADLDGTVDGVASVTATVCLGPCTDTNPADYKRIVSLVRWPGGYNLQTSQVNSPGQAAAPAVTKLIPTPPATNTITTPVPSLGLTAVTTNSPATVALYRDGTALQPGFSGSGNSWTATWNLGSVTGTGGQPSETEVLDGSYQMSAKAFDRYGQYGATRSQTVVVNRRVAFAPANVAAGRNGGAVEIEWSPAKEHDSAGFRVDRRIRNIATNAVSGVTTVCSLAVRTQCRDATPPAPSTLSTVEYAVVGYDTADGQPRPGDGSQWRSVDPTHALPESPASLQAAASGNDVVLTWTAPTGLVDHYNIYRDGQTYNDRLDSVYLAPGQSLSYTDTQTTGQAHDYWITAVNDQLGESSQLGPVRK